MLTPAERRSVEAALANDSARLQKLEEETSLLRRAMDSHRRMLGRDLLDRKEAGTRAHEYRPSIELKVDTKEATAALHQLRLRLHIAAGYCSAEAPDGSRRLCSLPAGHVGRTSTSHFAPYDAVKPNSISWCDPDQGALATITIDGVAYRSYVPPGGLHLTPGPSLTGHRDPRSNTMSGPGIAPGEIENRFSYHAPKPEQLPKYERLREEAKRLAETITELTPPSREQSEALTCLETSVMFANAAIARRS